MRCVRCILINTHLRYQCLEFTKLKCTRPTFAKNHNTFFTEVQDQNLLFTFFTNDYEAKFRQIAFSELVRISHRQHLPPKFISISAFTLSTGSRLTSCTGFHFVEATFVPHEFIRNCLQLFCNFNSPKNLHLPFGKIKHRIH